MYMMKTEFVQLYFCNGLITAYIILYKRSKRTEN